METFAVVPSSEQMNLDVLDFVSFKKSYFVGFSLDATSRAHGWTLGGSSL